MGPVWISLLMLASFAAFGFLAARKLGIVAHLAPAAGHRETNLVDGDNVPVRHFGVVLSIPDWEALAAKFKAAGQAFVIEPHIRFRGQPGEQATMFFLDPFGNALEFKAFRHPEHVFTA